MPGPNPIVPPPGGAGGSNKYPQYGLNPSTGEIKSADTSREKVALIKSGYVDWFLTRQAAENAYKGMQGVFGSGNLPNPLHGIDSLGATFEAFYDDITDPKLWRSIGWIALGIVLLVGGVYLWVRTSQAYESAQSAIAKVI